MRKRIIVFSALTLMALAACTYHLAVPLLPQQTSMWCWAASGQMVMQYINSSKAPTQCTEANNRFGLSNCCTIPTPSACIQGGWPEFTKYGFTQNMTTSGTALSYSSLRNEMIGSRPVAYSWGWTGGGGHMMVAIGVKDADSSAGTPNMVEINDPWPPNVGDHEFITYDWYVAGTTHVHWVDYYNIKG